MPDDDRKSAGSKEIPNWPAVDQIRQTIEGLRPPFKQLQAVRVCLDYLDALPGDWEGELDRRLDALPAPAEYSLRPGRDAVIADERHFSIDTVLAGGLVIERCGDFTLGCAVEGAPDATPKHMLIVSDCEDFVLDGITLAGLRGGLFLHRCRRFRIKHVALTDLDGCGIILFDCCDFALDDVRADGLLSATILFLGSTTNGAVRHVSARNGRGPHNADAGLHFNHCTPDVTPDMVPDACHEARSILAKTKRPGRIRVEHAHIENNRAQGVYLEGAVCCTIRDSLLAGNNKEGICFDWGTSLCALEDSVVARNGHRANLTREEIAIDFLELFPLLPDGSSSCKLPAIACDNASFNRIRGCRITENAAGAIKLVRASVGTEIVDNYIQGNARGATRYQRVPWFYSADLQDIVDEFTLSEAALDFGASVRTRRQGNVVLDITARERALAARLAFRHYVWALFLRPRLDPALVRRFSATRRLVLRAVPRRRSGQSRPQ